MARSIIGLVLVGWLASAGVGQPEQPDPHEGHEHDATVAADRAVELLQQAEIAMKRHDVEEAEKLLHRALEIDAPGDVGRRVFFYYVHFLVKKGDPQKALHVLKSFGENRTLGEDVAEEVAKTKVAVEAIIESRNLRLHAFNARLRALEADMKAERAEARAQLLMEGVGPEEIDRHLQVLLAAHKKRLDEYNAEIVALRSGRPTTRNRARTALERLLRAQGREPEEAIEEAEKRMRAVDEARKRFEEFEAERARLERALAEARRDLEIVERAHQEGIERRRPRAGRGPGPGRRMGTIGGAFLERRLAALGQELEKADSEGREDDAKRLRAEIRELMRDAALRDAHRDARDGRGRDSLENRVDKIESEVREIRRLVERLLEERK